MFWEEQIAYFPFTTGLVSMGTQYCSWLRHYATSPKVADPIPDEVIGFLNLPNPSRRTMARESTQPLTETSTRNRTLSAFTACYRDSLT
jgi:hypothetical protein